MPDKAFEIFLTSGNPQYFYNENFLPYEDEVQDSVLMPGADIVYSSGKPVNQQSVTEFLINADHLLPRGEEQQMEKVVQRAVGSEGNLIGSFNKNPALKYLMYEVEFPYGDVKKYTTNVISENVLMNVNSFGYTITPLR